MPVFSQWIHIRPVRQASETGGRFLKFKCQYCGADIFAGAEKPDALASCIICGMQNVIPEGLFHRFRIRGLLLWGFISAFAIGIVNFIFESLNFEMDFKYVWFLWFHALILVWSLWKIRRLRISARNIIGSAPEGYKWLSNVSIVVPLMLFAIGSGGLFAYLLTRISPSFAKEWFAEEELSAFQIFFLIILVPPIEELLFRGILINRWAEKWDIKRAVFASTIVFAALHKNIIGATAYGFAFAVLYINTRTLIVPLVCHILINALAIGIANIDTESIVATANSGLIFSLSCLILSIPWLVYFVRKNWPSRSWNIPYFVNKVMSE
jgi:membrane protease YdiL (CAAX protease family)/ribosomal protein S27E